jgi:hypothetical protein
MKQKYKPIRPSTSVDPSKLMLDVKDAAFLLSMSTQSVRKMVTMGRLNNLEGFRKLLFSRNEIIRFAESCNQLDEFKNL